jgi:hypothetical protein
MVARSRAFALKPVLVVTLLSMIGVVGVSSFVPSTASLGSLASGGWRREPGGSLSAVTVNPAGMIYVTGAIHAPRVMPGTNVHVTAMVVAKYGPAGGLVWRRTWRRGGLWFAAGLAVTAAPAGGVYVAGDSGWYEGWSPVLWRYASSGRIVWHRTLPAPLGRGDMTSIASDSSGVVAAVNNSDTGGPTAGGSFIYAFDHAGKLVWRTEFAAPGISGTMNGVRGVTIGPNGRVYAVGFVDRAPLNAQNQDRDVVVQQLDRAGHVRWTRVLADPGMRDNDEALSVDVRPGLVAVSGERNGGTRGAVWAFTSTGERRWTRSWGQKYHTTAPAVTIAPWGPVYVASDRTVYGPGATSKVTGSLRRYGADGTFVSRRAADTYVSGVDAADALYLVAGRALERWTP